MGKSTTPKSRQRRRTETAAIALLDGVCLTRGERAAAILRIRRAKQPRGQAKRIIAKAIRKVVAVNGDGIDHADVQELRVKLIRRDGGVWSPQSLMLRRMECRIVGEGMTRQEFDDLAAAVWRMPQVLPSGTRHAA